MALLTSRLGQWLTGVFLLILVLAALGATGAISPLEDAASAVFGPVQRAFRQGAEPVANLVRNIDDFDRADDENRALRNRIEQLETEIARLGEEQIALRSRESLAALQLANPEETFVTAELVTRDLTGLRQVIGINRGSRDGVEVGMPVLASGGSLVGVIMVTRSNSSFVRLITDPDSSLRGLHQQSRTEGVISGDTLGNLDVQFVAQTTDIQPGHLFVTSGFGGLLPGGIPIGRVASAEGSPQEVFKRIRLRPIAPLDQLESVLIQVTFRPEPIPPPTEEELLGQEAAGEEDLTP
jgi:rod shape-determining protein MreC